MHWSHRHVGTMMICLAILLLALGYYFAFHAGCVFDGKQGVGSVEAMETSERYSLWSFGTELASFISVFIGIYIVTRRNTQATIAIFLLVLTLGVPFTLWLSFEGSVHGTQTCHPS